MTLMLVPHEVTDDAATVWVGALGHAPLSSTSPSPPTPTLPTALSIDTDAPPVPLHGRWQRFEVEPGGPTLHYLRHTFTGLEPATDYRVTLHDDTASPLTARTRTLPRRLPHRGEPAFTVLLGSCYYLQGASSRALQTAIKRLPAERLPDLKILCGDQVYLDAPARAFLQPYPLGDQELRTRFFETYRRTWTDPGFASLLALGPNYFTPDDHELWNNAPNPCAFATNTWTERGRKQWMAHARALFDAFQAAPPLRIFDVGPLSFAVVDTRMHRAADRSRFVSEDTMKRLRAWIRALEGPGVLVLGQPLLDARAGLLGNVVDWHLADYAQMQDLVRAIAASQHSVVVLSGDVHFSRVTTVHLSPQVKVVEVISSPMSLVKPGYRQVASDPVWAIPVPGLSAPTMTLDHTFLPPSDHFKTLDFTAEGKSVEMTVRYWPIEESPVNPPRTLPPYRLW
ncbi:hypothetical protein [Chondromyces apiculatus]|uniref:Phosphodiesterase/alkaline phosphatase D n=1 Tax=Chondromyces apiculatus DSM 436 TaxID=1192034 RepID=A0A017SYG5_9BACT|nr:hypothetical protein [Chondromyces apiculatus]EYF01645.1 Hypothetical protein CAP_7964 [Chondromyces apiculatus DSM 436]